MLSPLRNRFGIPGVISAVALVFAMLGGAYAANNSSGGGKATASAKAKKGPRGPKGATGPAGPAGAQGPAGANGKDGANGSNGDKGATGSNGTAGQSVTSVSEPPGGNCENGGYKLTSASGTQYVCNGSPGEDGQTGFTETLPVGKTETGAWGFYGENNSQRTTLSFSIPLAGALPQGNTHIVTAKQQLGLDGQTVPSECSDGVAPNPTVLHPEADSKHLCVFEGSSTGEIVLEVEGLSFGTGASTTGAVLYAALPPEGFAQILGSFAVTG